MLLAGARFEKLIYSGSAQLSIFAISYCNMIMQSPEILIMFLLGSELFSLV